jgi:pimeloyl-[acyl-carrier protein] methyl ester esterase
MDASGIKLVLLPGMYGTGELFADFVEALRGAFAVQVVGYPNDRFLTYAELLDLIRSLVLGSEPYVIVAESFSSTLAIQFATTHPANLKGLVLSAGFATSPMRGLLRWLCLFLLPIMPWLPVPEFAGGFLLFMSSAPESLQARVRDAVASAKPKVLRDRARAVLTCNALEDLGVVNVPMLYLQARHDRLVSAACLEDIRRVKPEIEAVVLNGPHLLLQAMPQETAEIVANFVRRL